MRMILQIIISNGTLDLVTGILAKISLGTGIWAKFRLGTGIWYPPSRPSIVYHIARYKKAKLTPISSPSCAPGCKLLPTRTQRTILWLMWAKCVSSTVLPSLASKLWYSTSVRLKASLTSARYRRNPVLW